MLSLLLIIPALLPIYPRFLLFFISAASLSLIAFYLARQGALSLLLWCELNLPLRNYQSVSPPRFVRRLCVLAFPFVAGPGQPFSSPNARLPFWLLYLEQI